MSQKYKELGLEEESSSETFQIPDTRSAKDAIRESLQKMHQAEDEENEKQGKPKKQKRGGTICCCYSPGCTIGPFVEKN